MRFVLRIEAPEDGDAQPESPEPLAGAFKGLDWRVFEPVLERELLDLCPEAARYELAEASVTLLTPEEIRRLNRDYRECDEATDVLSFPLCEWEPADGRLVPDFPTPVLSLGDIVICPEETARLHPELPEREAMCLMLAHSFLHLLGWDHDTEERQNVMWARQDALKARLMAGLPEAL